MSVSICLDLLMSQFWQNLQARLQPAVRREDRRSREEVIERLLLDGIDAVAAGATVCGQDDGAVMVRPNEAEASLARLSLHARGQMSHWTRPSSRRCQWEVSTTPATPA